ncbi:MAG: hypothetical protein PHG57_01335 [Eubacteriales bacterium]|jgi:hypothetical protein|nr:hypothetical protein [Eubacteriales bacterium]
MAYFRTAKDTIQPKVYRSKLKSITVRVFISDCTGKILVTNLLLQGGSVATGWVGHPSEIRFSLDG